jgi:hydroxymethylglutaryl-CoA reductase (NADPH)
VSCSSSSSFSRDDDQEIIDLVLSNQIKDHELERRLGDCNRAVTIRRQAIQQRVDGLAGLDELPHTHYDYQQVHGTNCEIVVGYVPIPVGLAGPLMVNGVSYHVPMATTEGCLVASTNRGCKAIGSAGGATAVVMQDAITRAPCVRMPTASQAAALKIWCQDPGNFELLRTAFESTTSFGKLVDLQVTVAGKNAYLRLSCFSGDAMGMNMVSKGSLAAIECLRERFPDLQLVALSGNMCTDKKAASTNWIHGRGKSVVAEATIPASIVTSVLKTTVDALVETNLHKNLIGSAMAGTVGGYNAHASNIVTAIFLATGQDPAQNVESSNCITLMEKDDHGDLWISCTMPSLEVGTVGGGTSLQAQAACLKMLSCHGGSKLAPGENSQKLATIVASTVMAGELSLLAALAANTLVQAHMQHNRKKQT